MRGHHPHGDEYADLPAAAMTGHIVELAALLVEPHPGPALLMEDVGGLLEHNPAIEHCRFGGELVQQLRDGRKALVKSCLNPTLRACTR